jgi:shikimate dehydrogenase
MEINGETKPIAILGKSLGHSLSPVMHNFYFRALDLNHIYLPLEVEEKEIEFAIRGLWSLGFIGANVTIPYKRAVMDYLVEISEDAKYIGAVNTLVRSDGGFKGDNTDGRGFINAILEETNWHPRGKSIVILGAGGSARAVGIVLALESSEKITLVNRTLPRAKEIADKITEIGAKAEIMPWDHEQLRKNISNADMIINTTPLGMKPNLTESPPINIKWLSQGQLVVDLIYNPLTSRFLEKAKERGCQVVNGLGMLIQQGILSFELWTGKKPPVVGMRELLEKNLGKQVSD